MTMNFIKTILLGGCCAGVLDFIGACIINAARGVTPLRIAQSIASGLLGRAACSFTYFASAFRFRWPRVGKRPNRP